MNPLSCREEKLARVLRERCPFVHFAILILGSEPGRQVGLPGHHLAVWVGPEAGPWIALESVLAVAASAQPELLWEVTLLNRADAITRYNAVRGKCLFVRPGYSDIYRQFGEQAHLDLRIMRAHARRRGIIDNS